MHVQCTCTWHVRICVSRGKWPIMHNAFQQTNWNALLRTGVHCAVWVRGKKSRATQRSCKTMFGMWLCIIHQPRDCVTALWLVRLPYFRHVTIILHCDLCGVINVNISFTVCIFVSALRDILFIFMFHTQLFTKQNQFKWQALKDCVVYLKVQDCSRKGSLLDRDQNSCPFNILFGLRELMTIFIPCANGT